MRGAFLVRAAAWARQTAAPVPWSAAGATARACAAALALVLGGAAHADTDVNSWIARSSGSWMEASSWSLGVVPWNDPRTHYLAIIPAAAPGSLTVTIGSAIPVIDALSIGEGAELEILAGAGLALAGGAIDNHGVIGLWASFGQPVTLRLEPEESVISGSGEIIAGDPAATICALLPNGRLVHAKGHRLTGAMALGADSMRLSNEGEIVAANGKITVDLSDGAGLNFNSGRLAAEAPGALLLQDLSLDNAGGVIESMPGAKVRLHGVSLMGGTLRDVDGAGPGSLRVTGDTSLEGVVVDGPISIGNFAYLRLRAGTHIGDLHQEGEAGISTTVRLETTPFTVPTGAMWTEAGGSANAITSAATTHTLLVETGATIAGGQRVGADSLRLENHGVIEASSATPMLVDLSNGDGINFNHGTMRAANGATLVIADCSIDNTDGVIEAAPGSIVRFGIGTYPNVGRVTRIAGGVIRRVDGDVPGRIEVVETLRIDSGTIVDAPVHVGALFWDSNYPPTLWVSPGGQVPAVVLLGGTDFPYAHAMLFSDAPVAEFANCEVTALPNASSQAKRVAGPWNPQTSALIMDSARFQGQIEFAFRSGVVNHGRIEAGPTESIVFTTNGQVIENASSGILRLAPAPTSRTATWVGSLVNHGDFELGAPR
ncbi:MAG: hypothetical protein FJ253_08030, partial [Phycisphaerae bacterium]|nr:hypothetical protein [Phycisphaerae bacterium]